MRHSNANFDLDQMDYQFDTKATDGNIGELSARKQAMMDEEIQAQYKLLYDLDVLAQKL